MSIKPAMQTPLGTIHQTRQNALYFMEAMVELGVPDLCTSFNVQALLGKQVKPTVDCILAIKDVFDRRVEEEERRVAVVAAATANEMAAAAETETETQESR